MSDFTTPSPGINPTLGFEYLMDLRLRFTQKSGTPRVPLCALVKKLMDLRLSFAQKSGTLGVPLCTPVKVSWSFQVEKNICPKP
jgi:hypothetical protein